MPPTRVTRAEKQAATRQQLLAATERIARREGFSKLSVARIAEEAGLTTGAIYSAFGSKEQLVLKAAQDLTGGLVIDLTTAGSLDVGELLEHLAGELNKALRTRSKNAVLAFEFITVALRDTKLRQAMLDELAAQADLDPAFDDWAAAHTDELPLPAEQFLEVLNALAWGFMLRRLLLGTKAVPDDLVSWTYRRLAPDPPSSR
jgi:AcrR family transcriptional regulator